MIEVTMPRLSESMLEGTIVQWLVDEGELLRAGDDLVEVETDKATMVHAAEVAGRLRVLAAAGTTVAVGERIAQLLAAGETADPAARNGTAAAERDGTAAAPVVAALADPLPARIKASPVARRVATQHGVDLAALQGTGRGGRIVRRDVEGAVQPAPALTTATEPLTHVQRTIARRMTEAKGSIPDFTVTLHVDMEAIVALRAELAQALDGSTPSFNDVVIRACALALKRHPRANSSLLGSELVLHPQVNVGVAVATPGALLVPTVFDADRKSLTEIAAETRRLAQRGRSGELSPAELSPGTFTVSNLGMLGISQFTAIVNPPQVAILAVGAVEERAVATNGELSCRRVMTLTLTSDHRVLYGADAAAFLADIRDLLQAPLRLLV